MSRIRAGRSPFVLIALIVVSTVQADTIYVDDGAVRSPHNGTSWCSAFLDLQDALAVAQPGDQIRVAAGLYTPDRGTGDRLATFTLKNGVSHMGGYAGCGAPVPDARDVSLYVTVLGGDLNGDDGANFTNYADNSYHVVTYNNPAATGVVLDGFTITGGNADGPNGLTNQGGGIHIRDGLVKCLPGGPTIRNCIVEWNWGAHHGAINDHGLSTVIENCTIRFNYAGAEGGGLQVHSGAPTITNCTFFINESGGEGGGAWVGEDTDPTCSGAAHPRFEGCTFWGNEALRGGGLFNSKADLDMTNCTISLNEATAYWPEDRRGGGLYNAPGTSAVLTGCTLKGNSAFRGGAMYNDAAIVTVRDTLLESNNTPPGGEQNPAGEWILPGGGGFYSTAGSVLTLTDSSLRLNTANRFGGAVYADGESEIHATRCVFDANRSYYSAFYVQSATFRADDCTFSNSFGSYGMNFFDCSTRFKNCLFELNATAAYSGGALFITGGVHDFANCRFEGNHANATGGAATFGSGAVVRLANCVFRGNSATTGGAVWIGYGAQVEATNLTSVENTAPTGASLSMGPSPVGVTTLTVHNSILWDAWDGVDNAVGEAVSIEFSDVLGGWSGLGNLHVDPQLQPDLRLSPDSQCVDAGRTQDLPYDATDLDQDGDTLEPLPMDADLNIRVARAAVDMGAYEFCQWPQLYGDVDRSGVVTFLDISLIVRVFQGQSVPVPIADTDLHPCQVDGLINFQDVSAGVDAFKQRASCASRCLPGS